MKTKYLKISGILSLFILSFGILSASAQNGPGFTTVSGVVKDAQSKRKLEHVNISVPGTGIGTVTNADGVFTLKVADSLRATSVDISHVGYFNRRFSIGEQGLQDAAVFLTPYANTLQEVVVHGIQPMTLVKEAINKIAVNNSSKPNLLTAFYRETIKKKRNYIHISEAVTHVYKTPYTENVNLDRTQVYKGRRLLSQRAGDTLIVKLQGGPNLSVYLDAVKNRDLMLDVESLSDYKFKMEKPVMIDNRSHYVISFEPQVKLPYPLFYGKLYIDEATLSFSRAEFSLDMSDRNKAARAILKKKPFNLRFKPEEVTYLVNYNRQNGCSYLNYIRSEISFKCDWKRKLFSTSYAVVSEMVVTDRKENNVSKIPSGQAFSDKHSLSDKVSDFYDENFWEDYNIIEPTESLEAAVNKLMKKR